MSGNNTKRRAEAVEDELREMGGCVTMTRKLFAGNKVGNAEVEHGTVRKEDNVKSGGFLLV